MSDLIRRFYRYVLDESVGLGAPARWLRRTAQKHANGPGRVGNIVMFHAGRCGSSVLADMLGHHDDITWANEPFESMKPAYRRMAGTHRARRVIADRMFRHRTKFFGFDVKYLPEQHLRAEMANKPPSEFISLFEDLGFHHFILLNRRNHLRRAVSVAIGGKTGLWNTFQPVQQSTTVRLDPDRFVSYGKEMPLLEYFQELDRSHAAIRDLVRGHTSLELTYEAHIEVDPRIAYRDTCRFLGLAAQEVPVRLKKMNPQPVGELIENFDEIRSVLNKTAYAWMLEG